MYKRTVRMWLGLALMDFAGDPTSLACDNIVHYQNFICAKCIAVNSKHCLLQKGLLLCAK